LAAAFAGGGHTGPVSLAGGGGGVMGGGPWRQWEAATCMAGGHGRREVPGRGPMGTSAAWVGLAAFQAGRPFSRVGRFCAMPDSRLGFSRAGISRITASFTTAHHRFAFVLALSLRPMTAGWRRVWDAPMGPPLVGRTLAAAMAYGTALAIGCRSPRPVFDLGALPGAVARRRVMVLYRLPIAVGPPFRRAGPCRDSGRQGTRHLQAKGSAGVDDGRPICHPDLREAPSTQSSGLRKSWFSGHICQLLLFPIFADVASALSLAASEDGNTMTGRSTAAFWSVGGTTRKNRRISLSSPLNDPAGTRWIWPPSGKRGR